MTHDDKTEYLKYLNSEINNIVEDIRYFEHEKRYDDIADLEKCIMHIKDLIRILESNKSIEILTITNPSKKMFNITVIRTGQKTEIIRVEKYPSCLTLKDKDNIMADSIPEDITDSSDFDNLLNDAIIIHKYSDIDFKSKKPYILDT